MIITQDGAPSDPKAKTSTPADPPAYTESSPMAAQSSSSPYYDLSSHNRPEPAGQRFWKSLLAAVVIYAGISLVVSEIVYTASGWRYQRGGGHRHFEWNEIDISPNADSDPKFYGCASHSAWQEHQSSYGGGYGDWRYATYLNFTLSSLPKTIVLDASGSYSSGSVDVHVSEGSHEIKAGVEIYYYTDEALSRAKVCTYSQKDKDEGGFTFYTPKRRDGDRITRYDYIQYRVQISVPHGYFKSLKTTLDNFSQSWPDLTADNEFTSISLISTNGAIHAEALEATDLQVKSTNGPIRVERAYSPKQITFSTSNAGIHVTRLDSPKLDISTRNGPIVGSFNATDEIELVTTNANIDVTVYLTAEHKAEVTPKLVVKTSNGPLVTKVHLLETEKKGTAQYDVYARTSNNKFDVQFGSSPVGSVLTFDGATSNAPAYTKLHPNYEGSFILESSLITPKVIDGHAEDPTGKGRDRKITYSKSGRKVQGKTSWDGKSDDKESSVYLATSNSPATLEV